MDWIFQVGNQTLNKTWKIEFLYSVTVPYLKRRVWKKSIFQQDGARPHTSNYHLDKLKKLFPWDVISNRREFEWSSHSPDLPPLTFLWAWFKKKVYNPPKTKNTDELIQRICQAYLELPAEMIKNAIDSIPNRLENA